MPGAKSYEDVVLEQIYEQGDARAKGMAGQMGKPPGTTDLTAARELREWNRSDDRINVQALLAAGKSIEDITRAKHPNRVRLIESHSPDWSERCKYAESMKKKADEAQMTSPALSELDAMGPVEPPSKNGAGYG